MKVFAIGDLHLSGVVDKPMDIFGPAWENHAQRIREAWQSTVAEEDLVLLPGDFSWAMKLADAKADIQMVAALPGTKLLLRGNHDYWWNSLTQVRAALPPGMYALQNDSFSFHGVHVAGTRGWVCPGSANFLPEDQKIYEREVLRLGLSLSALPKDGCRIAMLHYPPFNESRAPSGFSEQLEKAGIQLAVYGHLHGRSCRSGFEGVRNRVEYALVSADNIGFAPRLLFAL